MRIYCKFRYLSENKWTYRSYYSNWWGLPLLGFVLQFCLLLCEFMAHLPLVSWANLVKPCRTHPRGDPQEFQLAKIRAPWLESSHLLGAKKCCQTGRSAQTARASQGGAVALVALVFDFLLPWSRLDQFSWGHRSPDLRSGTRWVARNTWSHWASLHSPGGSFPVSEAGLYNGLTLLRLGIRLQKQAAKFTTVGSGHNMHLAWSWQDWKRWAEFSGNCKIPSA